MPSYSLEKGNKMDKVKAIILAVAMIMSAIGGYLAATLDDDPKTKKDLGETITEVREGAAIIKETLKEEAPAPVEIEKPGACIMGTSHMLAVASAPPVEDPEPDDTDLVEIKIA